MIKNKAMTTFHEALRLHYDILLEECVKTHPKFDQFFFHFKNERNRFNVFTHKNLAFFKVDYFKLENNPAFDDMFLKAINFKLETVDKVINAYFKAAYAIQKNGLISFIKDDSKSYVGDANNYLTFTTKCNQEHINKRCQLAVLKFNDIYRTNKRYFNNVSITSKIHFYIDDEQSLKPVVIINTYFDPEYELNFVVDIDSSNIYATKKIYAGRSYTDLMSMSRPVAAETLDESMYRHFVDRLIPLVKKRYGVKKADMNIYDLVTREQYISLMLMEAI